MPRIDDGAAFPQVAPQIGDNFAETALLAKAPPLERSPSVAAHENVERVDRPGISAEIPPHSPCVCGSSPWRPSALRRRISSLEPAPPSWSLLGGTVQAGRAVASDVPPAWRRASLSGGLRLGKRQDVWPVQGGQDLGRIPGLPEVVASPLPTRGDVAHRSGQLWAAREGGGPGVGPEAPHSLLLDADRCLLARPHRMPIHGSQEIRPGELRLPNPR